MENSTKETIMNLLKDIRKQNPKEIIFLLIDNFSSHKADVVKNLAKELNIELCYLPAYSPNYNRQKKYGTKTKETTCNTKLTKSKTSKKWIKMKN